MAGGPVEVRAATLADVTALRELAAAAYQPYVRRIGRKPAPMEADYQAAVGHGEVWVATCDAQLVGLIVLIEKAGYLLLENVAVAPAAQGKGIGTRLLALAEDQAARLGLTQIRLYTNVAMTENLAFYPRHGYRETHRGWQDGFQRVFFAKSLGPDERRASTALGGRPPVYGGEVTLTDSVRRLLDEPNHAVLATINADGSPQTSLVWVGREGDEVVISSAAGRRKDRNIRRDPRVSLSVWDGADAEVYAEIRGTATVTEDEGRALAIALGEKYEGPGGGESFKQLPPEVVRIVIRIAAHRVAGNAAG
jgi:PPOX class probable F420-dependent enzyme